MRNTTGFYPRVRIDGAGKGVVSHAGGSLLTEAVRISGLDRVLAAGLAPWRKPRAIHDPAKVVTDLAITLALGGDCLADIGLLRAEPGVFGRVASDPTVSRTIDALAKDAPAALTAINTARAVARARVWELAGQHAPHAGIDAAARWSSTSTPPWSRRTQTRSPLQLPINGALYLHARAMSYSVGFTLPSHTPQLLELIPDSAWTPA